MNAILGAMSSIDWFEVTRLIIDLLIKGAVLCGLGAGVTLVMRRSPACARKAVWVAVLACLTLLPVSALVAPAWNLPILPALRGEVLVTGDMPVPAPVAAGPVAPAKLPAAKAGGWNASEFLDGIRSVGMGWIGLLWLAGAAVYLAWFAVSRHLLKRLVARAVPLEASWDSLLRELSYDLDIRRPVQLLRSRDVRAAITVGVLRPVIILPDTAAGWREERRRLVLSHELAHVKRWDSLIEILGFAATALHWFNPLVWLALNRLRIERERDCDNAVINSGAKPSDYASLLMEIATDMQRRNRPMWQLATISEGSNLKDRLLCILDPKVNRGSGSRASVFVIGAIIVAFTIPLSGSHIWKKAVRIAGGSAKQEETAGGVSEKYAGTPTGEEKKAEQAEKSEALEEEEEKKKEQYSEYELKKKKAEEARKAKQEKPMNLRAKLEDGMKDDKTRGTSAARVIGLSAYDHGPDGATKAYKKVVSSGEAYYFDEKEFNQVGYTLLNAGKTEEAVAVFALNVEMYPDSWNVYDSLAEGYLGLGKIEKARSLYAKSLKVNPDNANGKKMLAMIEKKHGK